jgi:hypothetical protein
MRANFTAVLVALSIGLLGATGANAAPMSGPAVLNGAQDISPLQQVQHWRWGSGGWRWGGGGHWRWGSNGWRWGGGGHWRWGSGGRWRW